MSSSSSNSSFDENILKGKLLNDKYVVIHKIGKGAFSTVWLSLDITSKKYYAIKILYPEDYDTGLFEIDLQKKLNKKCKYINNLIDNFIYSDVYVCMVFDLMAGSVYDIMKSGKYSNGLPLKTAKNIIYQLLLAMDYLTNKLNILHTDIKPDNMLVVGISNKLQEFIDLCNKNKQLIKGNKKTNYGKIIGEIEDKLLEIDKKYKKAEDLIPDKYIENIEIRLSDFGNCIDINNKNYKIQTRYYRAPEIILECEFSEKCDMWSVGCVMYELLTGKVLFDPMKEKRFYTDRSHLHLMICLLGKIPDELVNKSKRKIDFFKKNGLLKGNVTEFVPIDIKCQIDNQNFKLLNSFLKFIPHERPNINDALLIVKS